MTEASNPASLRRPLTRRVLRTAGLTAAIAGIGPAGHRALATSRPATALPAALSHVSTTAPIVVDGPRKHLKLT